MELKHNPEGIYIFSNETFELANGKDSFAFYGEIKQFKFYHCIFNFEIFINAEVKGNVNFIDCEFRGRSRLNIGNGNYEAILISTNRLDYLRITGGTFKKMHIGFGGDKTVINDIAFHEIQNISGEIIISKVETKKIQFSGINRNCDFDISESRFNEISIFNFTNSKNFRLKFIEPLVVEKENSQLNIQDSNLDKAEFYNVNLKEFNEVNIRNSHISNMIFINSDFPKEINAKRGKRYIQIGGKDFRFIDVVNNELFLNENLISEQPEAINKEVINNLNLEKKAIIKKNIFLETTYRKENYKQLKYVFSKQGDKINERYFHGKEMEEYLKMDIPFWDQAIINISKWSSDFGQSISRPILFNGITHIILCTILFVGMDYQYCNYGIDFYCPNLKVTTHLLKEGLYLFLPFNSFNKEFLIIDILMKVNSGLFLYNMIRATRKYYL